MKKISLFPLCLVFSLLGSGIASAATYTYNRSGGSQSWTTPAGYAGGVAPSQPTDDLVIISSAGLNLGGDREIRNILVAVDGALMGAGSNVDGTLKIHGELSFADATSSITFRNGSDYKIQVFANQVNVTQGTLILGGTGSSSSKLDGFEVSGTTTVGGLLYNNRSNEDGTKLGTLNVLSSGTVVLLGGVATGDAATAFSTTVQVRSLSGEGTVMAGRSSASVVRNATLQITGTTGEHGYFTGKLENGDGKLENGGASNVLHLEIGSGANQTLAGKNTYTGQTTISGGTLTLTGSSHINSTSGIVINNGGALFQNSTTTLSVASLTFANGTLGGSGAIEAELTVGAGQTLSPGDGVGTLTLIGNQTWTGGGSYQWQMLDAFSGSDEIIINGTLFLDTLSDADTFNIDLWTLSAPGVSGEADGFNPAKGGSWLLLTATDIVYDTQYDISQLFAIRTGAVNGTDGFANPFNGFWSITLSEDSTQLYLNYAPVPEPRAWMLLLGGLLPALCRGWRKRD